MVDERTGRLSNVGLHAHYDESYDLSRQYMLPNISPAYHLDLIQIAA